MEGPRLRRLLFIPPAAIWYILDGGELSPKPDPTQLTDQLVDSTSQLHSSTVNRTFPGLLPDYVRYPQEIGIMGTSNPGASITPLPTVASSHIKAEQLRIVRLPTLMSASRIAPKSSTVLSSERRQRETCEVLQKMIRAVHIPPACFLYPPHLAMDENLGDTQWLGCHQSIGTNQYLILKYPPRFRILTAHMRRPKTGERGLRSESEKQRQPHPSNPDLSIYWDCCR